MNKVVCEGYTVYIKNGLLAEIDQYIDKNPETIILTDTGIPEEYIVKVESLFEDPLTLLLPQGEDTKSIDVYKHVIEEIASRDFSRNSQIIALGGGVVGDLAGFVAATYLRGVKLIQVPTTLLSQVDSSVGSKVAINHFRKNNIGTFYDPEMVLIDPETLQTLSKREFNNGMAELIKYGYILDKSLLSMFDGKIIDVITRCVELKRDVVKDDKLDTGNRHILNFGHTIGHGIEIDSQFSVLHGEAVAIGMVKLIHPDLKEGLVKILNKFDLPTSYNGSMESVLEIVKSDKKIEGDLISYVTVEEIGKAVIKKTTVSSLLEEVL